jgi:hypothetical protein
MLQMLAIVARVQAMDTDGKIRQTAPALEAGNRRVRAPKEAVVPLAIDYRYDMQTAGVLYDVRGGPQLVVVGTQVGVPALVRAAREILDLSLLTSKSR